MHRASFSHLAIVYVVGTSIALSGIFIFGQSSVDLPNAALWRRTSAGWEHAESLPIHPNNLMKTQEIQFTNLKNVKETLHKTHRQVLPLAIAGFMICFGPWLLLRWPTSEKRLSAE